MLVKLETLTPFFEGTRNLVLDSELRALYSKQSIALSQELEQSIIVKQMLQNYKDVSDEFYEIYDGLHQIRDEEFINADSFRLGRDPRPFGFACVANVFVRTLQVVGSILNFFGWINARIHSNVCCKAFCGTTGVTADEPTDDIEYSLSTISKDELSMSEKLLDGEGDENVEKEKESGLCLSCMVGCLDSNFTYGCVISVIALFSVFFRFVSRIQWSCKSILCCHRCSEYLCCSRCRSKRKS